MRLRYRVLIGLTALMASTLLFALPTISARGGPSRPHPRPSPSPTIPPPDPVETVFSTNASNDRLLRLDFRTGAAAVVNSPLDAVIRKHLEGIAVRDDPPGVSVIACDSFGGRVVFYPNAQGPNKVTGQTIARIDAPDGVSLDTAGNLYLVSSPFGRWKKPRVWAIPRGGSRPGGYGDPVVIDPEVPAHTLEDTKVVNFTSEALVTGDLLVLAQTPATVFRYRKGASGWQRAVFIPPSRFPRFSRPTGITFAPNRQLLVSTFGGDVLRFDPTGARVAPDFASGCGNGRLKIASGIQDGQSRVFVANRSNGGKVLRFLFLPDGTGFPDGAVDERVNRPNGVGIASNTATPTPAGDDVEVVPAPEIELHFDTVTEAGLTHARLLEFVDNRACANHACDQGLREFFPDSPELQALVPDVTVPAYVQGIPKLLPSDPPGQPSGPSSFLLALIDTTAKFRRTVNFHAEEEKRGLLSPCVWLGSQDELEREPRTFYAPETAPPKSEPDLIENQDGALFVDISNGCGSNKGSGWNFSAYLTGADTRTPNQILGFKLPNLQGALGSFEDFIDSSVFADLAGNLHTATTAFVAFESTGDRQLRDEAQAALEEFRTTIDANPEAFDDTAAGRNVSGELVARAESALFILPKAATTTGPLITEFPLPTPTSLPFGIVTGPDGNLWFAEYVPRRFGRMTPSGVLTEFPLLPPEGPPPLYSFPAGAAVGSDGRIWFAEDFSHRVGAITTAGVVTYYPIPSAERGGAAPLPGPDGNLWILATKAAGGKAFFRMTTAGAITGEFPLPTAFDIAFTPTFGPDGNLWFGTGYGPNDDRGELIGRMTLDGVVTGFTVPTPDSVPGALITGPDGNLWFTENTGSKVGRITPSGVVTEFPIPSPNSHPFWTGIGPDGNVWFYDEANSNMNRISGNGVITEYYIPAPPGARFLGITTGPDGNLWFAETDTNKIGRLSQ